MLIVLQWFLLFCDGLFPSTPGRTYRSAQLLLGTVQQECYQLLNMWLQSGASWLLCHLLENTWSIGSCWEGVLWYKEGYVSITNLLFVHESLQQKMVTVVEPRFGVVTVVTYAWYHSWLYCGVREHQITCALYHLHDRLTVVSHVVAWIGSYAPSWAWHSTSDPKRYTSLCSSVPSIIFQE